MRVEQAGFRLSLTGWIVVVCVALAIGGLIVSGYGMAALVILGAGSVIAFARRGEPVRRVRVGGFEEVTEFPHSCDVVWDLIEPAEKSPLVDPSIRRGYHVFGTPDGLGEQQAFEHLDGSTTIIEVIEYQPGRRAGTRQVSPPGNEHHRTIQSVEPSVGGCVYTIRVEVDLPRGQHIPPDGEVTFRAFAHKHIAQIRQALAATDGPPFANPDPALDQAPWTPPEGRPEATNP